MGADEVINAIRLEAASLRADAHRQTHVLMRALGMALASYLDSLADNLARMAQWDDDKTPTDTGVAGMMARKERKR